MTKQGKHSTLSVVAKKAGVGTTTVSRVVNGGQAVDPKTLQRVQRAIRSLGYLPNQAARTLKGDRTRAIGFIVPSIADPFFSSCAEAAQAVAHRNDSLLIVLTTQNDPKTELDAVSVLIRHRVDGFVIAPSDSKELRDLVRRIPVPVVAFDRPIKETDTPCVTADHCDGARAATRHLIEHGYKRIACLTGEPNLYTIQERIRGYHEAVRSAGIESLIDTSVVDQGSAEHALRKLLKRKEAPDAVFSLKNSTTIHTFETLQRLKVPIPKKMGLLGYDDFELAGTLRPSISVIQQPVEELGRLAAELLFEKLFGPKGGSGMHGQTIVVKSTLIRRSSCGCFPDA